MSKLKNISEYENQHIENTDNWYKYENEILEYKDIFFDNLILELVRPFPLNIMDSQFMPNQNDIYSNRNAFRGHGGTLSLDNYPSSLKNLNTWNDILQEFNPSKILETGTNSCIFGFLCYKFLENFELTTLDLEPNSKIFVDKVNEYFNDNKIIFYEINTNENIEHWKTEKEFDFAFLDSGHDFHTISAELNFCGNKKIPTIVCDDTNLEEVNSAINLFLTNNNYTLYREVKGIDGSSMGYLKILKYNG